MPKTIKRIAFSIALGIATFSAVTPASAWSNFIYYDANGTYVGNFLYCDNGSLMYAWGTTSSYYEVEFHPNEPPC
jgi:hypothetical protein